MSAPNGAAPPVDPATRRRLMAISSGPPLDAAIIGGGINGCGIAEDLAARGLRVALFEKDDFGFGTTWRSTKLIHGGLRYLEHGDVRLVFESLRERAWLLRAMRHLVRPQRFVFPRLPWTRRPAWQLRTGLALYDLLARDHAVPGYRKISRTAALGLAPWLSPEARGGFTFFDARCLAPERLALELALAARGHGAIIANHTPVRRIMAHEWRVEAVEVEHGPERFAIPARAVINAAGPWVDSVNAHADAPAPALLDMTRGTHIVVETEAPVGKEGIFSTARSDGRVIFAVPQDGLLLIGTTDLRYEGDPGAIRPTSGEVDYLLAEAEALLPGLGLGRRHVRYAYAGLRPLQRLKEGPEVALTRRHIVTDHARQGLARGQFSVTGGKLSTFRPIARELAERLEAGPRLEPEPGAGNGRQWFNDLKAAPLTLITKEHLRRYGTALEPVLAGGSDVLCSHSGAIAGELVHAARTEAAVTLADVLMRRTGVAWAACRGLCCHREAARTLAPLLGWDKEREAEEVRSFEAAVDYHLPGVESLTPDGAAHA